MLGTRVAIRISQMPHQKAHDLIDEAFDRMAEIHRLMSFHEHGSDLFRLNHGASNEPVQVDPKTWQVLSAALKFSQDSSGLFDVTIADVQARSGLLPATSEIPEPGGNWRDIELLSGHRIRFRRPLWIDLGGIAKGYAVDCAVEQLRSRGVVQGCVNAGGDLRVFGLETEQVHLLSMTTGREIPVLEVSDAAVASSGGDGMHLNGQTRVAVDPRVRVSVVAPDCMTADALTKIVLADPRRAEALLPQYRAVAYLNEPLENNDGSWRVITAAGVSPC